MPNDFHDIRFPLDISLKASGGPVRRSDVVALASGIEHRSSRWAHSRRIYDVGLGVRSLDGLHAVITFFEERRGRLYSFRFHDRADYKSCPPLKEVTPLDQTIGTGDGTRNMFQLIKTYGTFHAPYERMITKPIVETVRIAVNGVLRTSGYICNPMNGIITFSTAPASGSAITAGYEFDVPVRFDVDALNIDLSIIGTGTVPKIPLVEVV
jgi:uncharacterized protein (TIGR02217 family)